MKHMRTIIGPVLSGMLLFSCSATKDVGHVRDDVYFKPSDARASPPPSPRPTANRPETVEDYFDSNTSRELGTDRGYYDVAYNDPHYYNHGRFGLTAGMGMGSMGWMSGWNGPGWGMGMGYGWGTGMNMGMGMGMGWGSPYGWYDPWDPWNPWSRWNRWNRWNHWNRPWGWQNPWMMGGWGMPGWGMGGWGYGNYWGPWGNCWNCYMPIIIGGSSSTNTVAGHRPSMGTRSGGDQGGTYQPRMQLRDPVGLNPLRQEAASRAAPSRYSIPPERTPDRTAPSTRPGQAPIYETTPRQTRERAPVRRQPSEQRNTPQRTFPDRSSPQRTSPQQRSGGFDRGSSPSSRPSGIGRPPSSPRPR